MLPLAGASPHDLRADLRQRKWRPRYTLRMAGILLTLFCIWLGWLTHRAQQQRIAVEQLRSVAATVSYDRRVEDLYVPARVVAVIGSDFFMNVVEVNLHYPMTGRQRLDLAPAQIDRAVDAMQRLPRLRDITFNYTGLCDDDLKRLAPLASQIESLHFREYHGHITGEGIRHLAGWPRLRELTVHGRTLNNTSLNSLANLPALQSLNLHGDLNEESFAAISKCKQLERLGLFACSFDGASLAKLQAAEHLKSVLLHNCHAVYLGPVSSAGTPIDHPRFPKTTYRFRPAGDFDILPPGRAPDKRYYERYHDWLNKMLPGVQFQEMYSS